MIIEFKHPFIDEVCYIDPADVSMVKEGEYGASLNIFGGYSIIVLRSGETIEAAGNVRDVALRINEALNHLSGKGPIRAEVLERISVMGNTTKAVDTRDEIERSKAITDALGTLKEWVLSRVDKLNEVHISYTIESGWLCECMVDDYLLHDSTSGLPLRNDSFYEAVIACANQVIQDKK